MRIGIVGKSEIPGTTDLAKKVMELFEGKEILLHQELAKKLGKKGFSLRELSKADAIVTIGGDGTVLRTKRVVPRVPVLGINLGVRGFLAEVEPRETDKAIRMLMRGKLPVIERWCLKTVLGGRRLPDALNDVVISSAKPGKTVSLSVQIDGSPLPEMVGDGLIVSTPTGSTAYARAAGGPILDPDLNSFLLVPICPTGPRIAPLVTSSDKELVIGLTAPKRDALVIVDGKKEGRIGYGQVIKISRSEKSATFFAWREFYKKLKMKL